MKNTWCEKPSFEQLKWFFPFGLLYGCDGIAAAAPGVVLNPSLSFSVCHSTECSVCSNYTREITHLSLDCPSYLLPLKHVCLITECMYERYDEAVFMWYAGDSLSECKHDEWYTPVCSVKRSRSLSICLLALSSYVCLVCGEMQFFMYSVSECRKLSDLFFIISFTSSPLDMIMHDYSAFLACKQNTSHHNLSFQGKTIVPPAIVSGQASNAQPGKANRKTPSNWCCCLFLCYKCFW